jgi:hypothetical protein
MTGWGAACGSLTLAALLVCSQASALDWRRPWAEPPSGALTEADSDEFAWRLFIALNWPADVRKRSADPRAVLGADRPVVWETWQSPGDIFFKDGSDPGPWAPGRDGGAIATERRFETASLKDLPNAKHIVGGVMVPVADPLAGASRLTEIRMNRAAYEFIRAEELYNLDGQLRAYAAAKRVDFPLGARDIKAQWRPISAEQRSRYHTVEVAFADGTSRLFGLTAVHLASKDQAHWFWATFEHVDNPRLPGSEGWQLASRDRFACRGIAADCNRAPNRVGLEGTVWQYYRLRGTLTGYVDGAGRPQRLANSELENGMQTTASCMTCHSRASIGVVAGAPARLPIFDQGHDEAPRDVRARRGYIGMPTAEWFGGERGDAGGGGDGGRAGAGRGTVFRPLDFVWSLSKAKAKQSSALVTPGLGPGGGLSVAERIGGDGY